MTIIIEVVSVYAPEAGDDTELARMAHEAEMERLAREIKEYASKRAARMLCGDVCVHSVVGERK